MATYALVDSDGNIINRIILDNARDWQIPAGQAIVEEGADAFEIGGTIIQGAYTAPVREPAPPLPPATVAVTPRQARLALNAAGLLESVNAAVAQSDKATQITWEFATEISRSDPLVATLGAALGLSAQQIDALFETAAGL